MDYREWRINAETKGAMALDKQDAEAAIKWFAVAKLLLECEALWLESAAREVRHVA
jgi:hypothetical protein